MPPIDAAFESYAWLVAAQRYVSVEERNELDRQAAAETKANRLRRKLPKVY